MYRFLFRWPSVDYRVIGGGCLDKHRVLNDSKNIGSYFTALDKSKPRRS